MFIPERSGLQPWLDPVYADGVHGRHHNDEQATDASGGILGPLRLVTEQLMQSRLKCFPYKQFNELIHYISGLPAKCFKADKSGKDKFALSADVFHFRLIVLHSSLLSVQTA